MRLPRQYGADQGISCGIEQHGMTGLSDTDFLDHGKEGIESVGGFDCSNDHSLPVIKNRHCDIDRFF